LKSKLALLHYTCPPVVGGVEEIIRQQASLLCQHHHHVKIIVGCGRKFSDKFEFDIDPLLGSRSEQIIRAQQSCCCGERESLEQLTEQIYSFLLRSLAGYDLLIAHNVLTMAYNLPLSIALHRIGHDSTVPTVSWNHDSP
jgi:hypothetical protein